jgi:hypothetical protein
MAADTADQAYVLADVCPWDLRRAYEWQACFASQQAESVANTAAFVSPAALVLEEQ